MRVLNLVYLLATSLALLFALSCTSSSSSMRFLAAATVLLDTNKEGAVVTNAKGQRIVEVVDSVTAAPGSDGTMIRRLNTIFDKTKQLVSQEDERKGKFDRILTIGDLHGDLKQSLELLKDLKIISHQPDYYKDLLAKWARNDQVRASKGLPPKKHIDTWAEDGVNTGVEDQDIAANALFNKRGELMGGTADEFHWAGKKLLLVVLGDALNVGPDDIAIAQLLRRLTIEAAEAGSKLVYLLGNHEMNNLKGNYMGVHPWSFESSGGEEGRRRLLSTETRLGRFLRSRPGVFYYDHLMFMHGGLMPKTIQLVQKATGHQNMTGKEIADTINTHLRTQLFTHENQPEKIDSDIIAATVSNVDYETNGEAGVLLVHPLDKCPLVEEANQMAMLQSQVVGHTPHLMPQYRFCEGGLYAIDFMLSQWKGGVGTPMAALELTRVPLPPAPGGVTATTAAASSSSSSSPHVTITKYKWASKLLIPRKDTLDMLSESHRVSRFGFAVLVVISVVILEAIIMLTRHIMKRRKALAAFAS